LAADGGADDEHAAGRSHSGESLTHPASASDLAGAAPLRDAVLSGRFFGAKHSDSAAGVASLLTGAPGQALCGWFGPVGAARLLGDADALRGAIDRDIAAIDTLISEQLDAILHEPRLRRLEGSWRGLAWLLDGIDPAGRVKVRLLNAPWAELCRDLERAPEADQSNLFRRVYEDEFGMPGGEPFGLLLIDHEVRHRRTAAAPTDDVRAIAALATVAAAAFAIVVLPASPALLGADRFSDLALTADPVAPLRDDRRWRRLAEGEDLRFVCVVMPRTLARVPWGDDPARRDGFRYAEYAPDAESRVWMSAIYPFASTVARAFATHRWPADVRGVDLDREGGGVVTDLPAEPYRTDPPEVWTRAPLDLAFSDQQERRLVELGLMPMTALPYTTDAAFASVRSLHTPAAYVGQDAEAATANARMSARINAMLCAARFAHYVKVIGRDLAGSVTTADQIEQRLQKWLNGYVNASISAGPDTRARFPLLAGRVTVRDKSGKPGAFDCAIQLQPHFQLDDVAASFRLFTDVAAPGRHQ
jgi:type VI secretion system protein ImpD/type VI secretion system protein ImpC